MCQGQQTVYPSPKYCYLAVHNFFHNLGLVDRVRNFCHTAQFLLNCPLDKRDRPVTANATTVILMEKGADVTPSCQFAAIQLSGVYCKKMRCSIVLKLIGLPIAGHFYIHALLPSARHLLMVMIHNSKAQALFWQIITCNDSCNKFAQIS